MITRNSSSATRQISQIQRSNQGNNATGRNGNNQGGRNPNGGGHQNQGRGRGRGRCGRGHGRESNFQSSLNNQVTESESVTRGYSAFSR
jgi:hypothetical protein